MLQRGYFSELKKIFKLFILLFHIKAHINMGFINVQNFPLMSLINEHILNNFLVQIKFLLIH